MDALEITRSGCLKREKELSEIIKREDCKPEVAIPLIRMRRQFKKINEETREELQVIQDALTKLALEYCQKDHEGKPLLREGNYVGLNRGLHPEFDNRNSELQKRANDYMKECVKITPHPVKLKDLPENLGETLDSVLDFIED